jgi:type IV secretion system protein TrbI
MELHPKPKQPIALNRPLIITVALGVTAGVALAIVSALTVSNKVKTPHVSSPSLEGGTTDKLELHPALKYLPEDYRDVETIKKFSSDTSATQLASLSERFNELQSDYFLLKQQVASQGKSSSKKSFFDPNIEKIKQSSLIVTNIGSKMDSAIVSDKLDKDKDADKEVPSPQQEEYYKRQNANAHKLAVMKGKDKPEEIYDLHNVIKPVSPGYQILSGTFIPASLITGMDTSVDGTIVAQVRQNMYDSITGKNLLIPKGSRLIGEYTSRYIGAGQKRVLLKFTRIIRPNGESISLGGDFAADNRGVSGIEGNVDNHWARIIGASTISAILSVGAAMAAGNSNSLLPTNKQNLASGFVNGISEPARQIVGREVMQPPTIRIPPGERFEVVVRKDIVLTRYNQRLY